IASGRQNPFQSYAEPSMRLSARAFDSLSAPRYHAAPLVFARRRWRADGRSLPRMNSTPAIRPHGGRLIGLAAIAIGPLSSCGGGGGGASDLKVKSTIFGFDPFTGGFDASGQQGEAPLIPVNMSVVFDFTTNLVPSSCSSASITVQEIDTS